VVPAVARRRISSHTLALYLCMALAPLLMQCAVTEESKIEGTLGHLVDALNARDEAAIARLYVDRRIEPVNAVGDSSAVFRMLHIPGGSDFESSNVSATVIDDRAQATCYLSGT